MADIIGFFIQVLILGVVVAYAVFALRRFGPAGPWPRGWRLGLLYLAALFGVIVFAALSLLLGQIGGFISCSTRFSPVDVWPCSLGGRGFYAASLLITGLPLFALWMRFSKKLLT